MTQPIEAFQAELQVPSLRVVLKAVAGGPPWVAILAGLPGIDGDRVVRVGDRFESLEIRLIASTFVELSGPDSVLRVKLPEAGR
jgi:hypothetical protein